MSGLCHDERVTATTRPSKVRLDQLLVERGLAPSRSRAQALLMAGRVRVGEAGRERTDRHAGDLVDASTPITVAEPDPFVSRGGHKLAAALDAFAVDAAGRVCLDVGASTGGFTDALLQRGATRVYAVDVGRGQLAEVLRRDPRVVSMERTNARTLGPGSLPEPVSLAVVDVSFISLALVLGPIASCFGASGGDVIALVKPQFEAGRESVHRGVVRDHAVHRRVIERTADTSAALGLAPVGLIESPIRGPEGNREFLLHAVVGGSASGRLTAARIAEVAQP